MKNLTSHTSYITTLFWSCFVIDTKHMPTFMATIHMFMYTYTIRICMWNFGFTIHTYINTYIILALTLRTLLLGTKPMGTKPMLALANSGYMAWVHGMYTDILNDMNIIKPVGTWHDYNNYHWKLVQM